MQILLSAYACEPGLGSEAAVGWGWATHLSPQNNVHVITRESNRDLIEQELAERPIKNLHFHYYDLPGWARRWKKGSTGVHLYYILWQYGAYKFSKTIIKKISFDIVHHVTFVSTRFPSFMGKLGPPFVFGPVAGGETAPIALWWSMDRASRIKEFLRSISIMWIKHSLLMRKTFATASHIITTSSQTTELIPKKYHRNVTQSLGIALSDDEMAELGATLQSKAKETGHFRVFFAGRFLHWKGMDFGLKAFSLLVKDIESTNLTMIGDGIAKKTWQQMCNDLNVDSNVKWVTRMSRPQFLNSLKNFDVLLFPSLHDSGGMVVLEAMAAGIPVVCLDIGGPSLLIDDTCGIRVPATTPDETINDIYQALLELATNPEKLQAQSQAAVQRANNQFTWKKKAQNIIEIYEAAITEYNKK